MEPEYKHEAEASELVVDSFSRLAHRALNECSTESWSLKGSSVPPLLAKTSDRPVSIQKSAEKQLLSKKRTNLAIFQSSPDSFEISVKNPEYLGGVDELLIKFQNIEANGDSFETFSHSVSIF